MTLFWNYSDLIPPSSLVFFQNHLGEGFPDHTIWNCTLPDTSFPLSLCCVFLNTCLIQKQDLRLLISLKNASDLCGRWPQEGKSGVGEWDREGKEANSGCGRQQVTFLGKWDSVLLGNPGRLHGHTLKYMWAIRKLECSHQSVVESCQWVVGVELGLLTP